LRCHTDHHSIALVGTGAGQSRHAELHHIASRSISRGGFCRARAAPSTGCDDHV
jgi:hypothetical protein